MATAVFRTSAFLICVGAMSACDAPAIQKVEHVTIPITNTSSPDAKESIREANKIVLGRAGTTFKVSGRGTCGKIRVRFGDTQSTEITAPDLAAGVSVPHTYSGWGGPKKVTAETVEDCIGTASTRVTVEPVSKSLAVLMPVVSACSAVPNVPLVRAGSVVTARALNSPENLINFNAVIARGIDGSPEVALGPPFTFPFPGLKAHSLVWRVGQQVEQGGNGKSFTVQRTGPLEMCVNDDVMGDNTGGWGIAISVDETNAE
jgi:hypothetical protein